MLAVFVNMGTVILGSLISILLKSRIKPQFQLSLMRCLALCTAVIGITSAIKTENIICLIICMVLGTATGELLHISDGIERSGDYIKSKLFKNRTANDRFTDGFVSACILFCIGSMTIVGSIEAGLNRNYDIIFAKSALDFVSSLAFGATFGIGVTCSALFILVFQGGITLLAGMLSPLLTTQTVTEMSAIGGTILIGMAVNMLELSKEKIKVANMLPSIFLPPIFFLVKGLL